MAVNAAPSSGTPPSPSEDVPTDPPLCSYVCGVKWMNCLFQQWDEARLYAQANRVADRNGAQEGGEREANV